MKTDEMKEQSFSAFSYEDWKGKAEESLKGKSIESLQKTTYEGIVLKPLYCEEDHPQVSELPGSGDFRRGADLFGYKINKWRVAQKIQARNPDDLNGKLHTAFQRGQSAISFEITRELAENPELLVKSLSDFYPHSPFAIDAKDQRGELLIELANQTKEEERLRVAGYIASDPFAAFGLSGILPENIDEFSQEWAAETKQASELFPNLRTVLVNTAPFHNGGANAVQELGIAAAAGVFYLQKLLDTGVQLEKALSLILFQFSIGSSFFIEIAKLRAARIIWSKIAETYGADPAFRGMQIAAETSSYTKTVYDPHVNLLRAGNEAFAAVLGGIQYLHVSPFDDLTGASAFSERIARNTQLILQEEMNLQNVADPAGGSWYIEALTNELAEKAWDFFQQIEARGGLAETMKANWLQTEISRIHESRTIDSFMRKTSMIGTNVYANLAERQGKEVKLQEVPGWKPDNQPFIDIPPFVQTRLSVPFEKLRNRAEALSQKGTVKPLAGLICLGSLKQYKPRLDFVKGVLAAGGIHEVASGPVSTAEAAAQFVSSCKTKHFCLCGSDDLYETAGFEILQTLKKQFPAHRFYLAGLPEKERQPVWEREGITRFIHARGNCHETLSAILTEMEVTLNEQAKA